jgi:LacI family transcriptional regulator
MGVAMVGMDSRSDGERPATLEDIAREAGVSRSTASRVLARARTGGPVDTPKAARVLAVAADLEYEPNLFAASLRTKRTYLLGVLVPNLTDVVLSTIYEGIDARAASAGYQTVVANTMDDPREQRIRAERLLQRGADALLFGDARVEDGFLDELANRGVPFVLVSRRHSPYDSATCDDYAGGRLVGNHLADLGHRDIAIIAGPPYASTGLDRTEGCLAALRERGIDLRPSRVIHSRFDAESGHLATRQLMSDHPQPTAIFAVNDITAIGAMGALRDLGYTAGRDVAVVGFNDISIAADLPLPLTSVRSPLKEMGREAVRLVLEHLHESRRGLEAGSVELRLQPHLVVRESSDPTIDTRGLRFRPSEDAPPRRS